MLTTLATDDDKTKIPLDDGNLPFKPLIDSSENIDQFSTVIAREFLENRLEIPAGSFDTFINLTNLPRLVNEHANSVKTKLSTYHVDIINETVKAITLDINSRFVAYKWFMYTSKCRWIAGNYQAGDKDFMSGELHRIDPMLSTLFNSFDDAKLKSYLTMYNSDRDKSRPIDEQVVDPEDYCDQDDEGSVTPQKNTPKKEKEIKIRPFYNTENDYYLINFVTWIKDKVFEEESDYKEQILDNLTKCCRTIITSGKTTYIFKESPDKPFVIVNDPGYGKYKYSVKYLVPDKRCKKNPQFILKTKEHHIFDLIDDLSLACRQLSVEPYHSHLPPPPNTLKFNVFPGFKAKWIGEVKEGDSNYMKIKPILDHIKISWAKKDEKIFKYILSWFAYPIKYLKPSRIVMFLKGKQGCGKGIIASFFLYWIYGIQASISYDTLDEILDKFNNLLAGRLFVVANETSSVFDRKAMRTCFNKLKSVIDSLILNIELKGKDKYPVPNIMNVLITSNHDGVQFDSNDKNRRYFCQEVDPCFVENDDHFNEILACMNEECGNIMYSYLLSLPDSDEVPLHPPPITDYKETLTVVSTSKHDRFLNEVFSEKSIILDNIFEWDKKYKQYYFTKKSLFIEYQHWANIKDGSETVFSTALIKISGVTGYPTVQNRKLLPDGTRVPCCLLAPSKYYTTIVTRMGTTPIALGYLYVLEMQRIDKDFKFPEPVNPEDIETETETDS